MPRVQLLAHHVDQLRASGLTDGVVEAAGIYTVVDPVDAGALLGWSGPGPAPALAFPYFDRVGNVVTTVLRPDEPRVRADGRAPKYEWPVGTEPHIYFPPRPLVEPAAWTDASRPLIFTEGIKKALAAVQAGHETISGQGTTIWHDTAFRKERGAWRLHQDLRGVPVVGRAVFVAFDGGDTTHNPSVVAAEARLARMLLDAGARVRLVRVPSADGRKVGLDDFLAGQSDPGPAIQALLGAALDPDPLVRAASASTAADGDEAVRSLLEDPSFLAGLGVAPPHVLDLAAAKLKKLGLSKSTLSATVREFRGQAQQGRRDRSPSIASTQKLETLLPGAHPALDCRSGTAVLGAPQRTGTGPEAAWRWRVATSDRRELDGGEEGPATRGVAALVAGRWSEASRGAFLRGASVPSLAEVFARVVQVVRGHLEFHPARADGTDALIALWTIGTYFHPIFEAYPYLTVEGPKGTGKTRILHVLGALAFNAAFSPSLSAAVLCRLVTGARCTLLLDEVEGLVKRTDNNVLLLSLLNAGYKRGGQALRCGPEGRGIEAFDVYSPKALAGIAGLNEVTADRAIRVVTVRGTDRARAARSIDRDRPPWSELRDGLHVCALAHGRAVAAAYTKTTLPDGIDNRAAELWRPLFCLAQVADPDRRLRVYENLAPLAVEDSVDKGDLDDRTAAFAGALHDLVSRSANGAPAEIAAKELAGAIAERLGRDVSPTIAGRWMRRLGFRSRHTKQGAVYDVGFAMALDELARLGWRPPGPAASRTSSPSPGPGTPNYFSVSDAGDVGDVRHEDGLES